MEVQCQFKQLLVRYSTFHSPCDSAYFKLIAEREPEGAADYPQGCGKYIKYVYIPTVVLEPLDSTDNSVIAPPLEFSFPRIPGDEVVCIAVRGWKINSMDGERIEWICGGEGSRSGGYL